LHNPLDWKYNNYYYPPSEQIAELQNELVQIIRVKDFLVDIFFRDLGGDVTEEAFLNHFHRDYDYEDGRTAKFNEIVVEVRTFLEIYGDYVKREAYARLDKEHCEDSPEYMIASAVFRAAFPGVQERDLLHNITKIGYAARLRYLLEADRRKLAMSAASIFYTAGIVLISIITVDQTIAVVRAAGWL
jgi:hypothetical protein